MSLLRVTLIRGADSTLLTFTGGMRVEADAVIGNDGVHSTVRAAVTEPSRRTTHR
jgi:salicylate hydroxylase